MELKRKLDELILKLLPFTRKVSIRHMELSHEQDQFGLKKYGKALDPFDDYDWLKMMEQEMVDGWKYLQCEREKREFHLQNFEYILLRLKREEDSDNRSVLIDGMLRDIALWRTGRVHGAILDGKEG